MNALLVCAVLAALLGAALVAGVFFAFSSFVMPALARLPHAAGIAAMQSINAAVINRSFLGVFFATAALSLLLVLVAALDRGAAAAPYWAAAGIAYLAGTVGVTVLGNVPLNDRLAAVAPHHPHAAATWSHYLARWTRLNALRAAAAALAVVMCALGLAQQAAGGMS